MLQVTEETRGSLRKDVHFDHIIRPNIKHLEMVDVFGPRIMMAHVSHVLVQDPDVNRPISTGV